MRLRSWLCVASWVLISSSTVSAKVRVAVMPTQLDDKAASDVPKLFDDYVLAAVHKLGAYEVIGQDDINTMLSFEQQRDLVNCAETSCLANIGGALGVEKLVVLKIARVGANWVATAKLLDLSAARVENRTTAVVPGDVQQLLDGVPGIVAEIFGRSEAAPVPVPAPTSAPTLAPTPSPAPMLEKTPAPASSSADGAKNYRRGGSPTIGLRISKNFSAPEGSANTVGVHLGAGYYFTDFFSLSASTRLDKVAMGMRALVYPLFFHRAARPAFGAIVGYSRSTDVAGNVFSATSAGAVAGLAYELVRHFEVAAYYVWRYNWMSADVGGTVTSSTGSNHNGDIAASWRF